MQDYLITYKDGSTATLSHWGIFGMKWGLRRYQNPDGSLTEAGKKRYSKSQDYSKENSSGEVQQRVKKLSNDELSNLITRLKLENEYKKLTMANMPVEKTAIKKTEELMGSFGNMATSATKIAGFAVAASNAYNKLNGGSNNSKSGTASASGATSSSGPSTKTKKKTKMSSSTSLALLG